MQRFVTSLPPFRHFVRSLPIRFAAMEWLGRASITFTHADAPLQLPLKPLKSAGNGGRIDSVGDDGSDDGHLDSPAAATAVPSISLAQLCRDSVPPCRLNPLLFNGHMQTMWTAVAKAAPEIHYRRRLFDADHTTHAGSFAVDVAVPPFDETHHDPALPPRTAYFDDEAFAALASDDRRPMLLVLHGLSGGAYEVYLRHCLAPLLAQTDASWAIAVVTARGCANSRITSGVLFNARATWDTRQVVQWARRTFPNRPLFGLGFSMGANILTNYVGEEGADCPLSAAVVVGNPFDLQVCNKALRQRWIGREVYQTAMGANVKRLAMNNRESITKHTSIDFDRLEKARYLYEFDRIVQCPSWGYPTEEAYYRDASSTDSVLNIRIPFLAVQAKDDPIAVEAAAPYPEFQSNPYTVMCMTSLGGHLSWFEPGGGRWHAKPVSNFLHKMATEIDLAAIPRDRHFSANHRSGFQFDPMRRRMHIDPDAAQ